jgi:chorismate synthase
LADQARVGFGRLRPRRALWRVIAGSASLRPPGVGNAPVGSSVRASIAHVARCVGAVAVVVVGQGGAQTASAGLRP